MPIKDKVVSLFVKRFLMPRAQILDKPGFVIFNVTGKNPIFARQVIMPEYFLVLLEKNIRDRYGKEGEKLLYSTGKKFGYRFSIMGNFSKRGDIPDSKLPDYINMINKFIEGTYASDISCEVDINIPKVTYSLKNFVVCSKIENAYFLPLGAASGLISFLLNNKDIEGSHVGCQSQGKSRCKIIYEPYAKLKEEIGSNVFRETDLNNLEIAPEYQSMNSDQPISNSNFTFKQFIDAGVFSFNQGIIMRGDQRYFIYEISGIYLLEMELGKNSEMEKIMFEAAFDTGRHLLPDSKKEKNLQSVVDLLTAFGWGDIQIFTKQSKYIVSIKYFPWTKFYDKINFNVFNGILAGLLSVISGREVKFKDVKKDISQGNLNIIFQE